MSSAEGTVAVAKYHVRSAGTVVLATTGSQTEIMATAPTVAEASGPNEKRANGEVLVTLATVAQNPGAVVQKVRRGVAPTRFEQ
eukprot:COSAG02_NODE_15138_length_1200_cov_1.723887_2_plen_84_part_00